MLEETPMTSRHRYPRQTRIFRRLRLRLALCGLAAVIAITACACGGGSSSPTPTVPAPVLSPVPSGVTIDLDHAAKLYHDGDYEGALTIYSAAALNGTPQQKQNGLWEIAKIQLQRGQHSDAEKTVRAFLATNPPADEDRQALLLLGNAELAQGEFADARTALEAYLKANGAAWPQAQLYLAQIDEHDGKPKDATDRINQALFTGLPPKSNFNALMALGQADEQANDSADGIANYRRAADAATGQTDSAEALFYLADAATTANDPQTASQALAELIVKYPTTQRAADALIDHRLLPNAAVPPLDRALVAFHHQQNDAATAAFQPIADAGGLDSAQAQYYLGLLSERALDWKGAIDQYTAVINSPVADPVLRAQAYWDRGTVLEDHVGLLSDAIDSYAAVVDARQSHDEAPEGLFRAGFLAYQLGRVNDALVYWRRLVTIAPDASGRARADYWLATASANLGDSSGAQTYLQAAVIADPFDYYGMRAQARLSGETALPDASTVTEPQTNWSRVESWLTGWAGPEPAQATTDIFASNAWLRAVEMYDAGFADQADEQWKALLSDNADTPWLEYRLLRQISTFDRPWVTAGPAELLAEKHPGAPPEMLRLAQPLEYSDLAQQQATTNGFSPLLLLALVRQESLYDPSVSSTADDTGLTQVVPATANEIAQQLGDTNFKQSDLLRANVALRYGGHYLASMLASFGGTLSPALAGYNAGPGTAGGWWDKAGGDPDLFLETINYRGTRTYVKAVLENYSRYLYAYGLAGAPTLPL
ncbi:MAG: tetratricopeptide repeat protein [Chloroflexota bacterium]|nr:tetratricopeptide repeat protein [Chloroflexota bacterium]